MVGLSLLLSFLLLQVVFLIDRNSAIFSVKLCQHVKLYEDVAVYC